MWRFTQQASCQQHGRKLGATSLQARSIFHATHRLRMTRWFTCNASKKSLDQPANPALLKVAQDLVQACVSDVGEAAGLSWSRQTLDELKHIHATMDRVSTPHFRRKICRKERQLSTDLQSVFEASQRMRGNNTIAHYLSDL